MGNNEASYLTFLRALSEVGTGIPSQVSVLITLQLNPRTPGFANKLKRLIQTTTDVPREQMLGTVVDLQTPPLPPFSSASTRTRARSAPTPKISLKTTHVSPNASRSPMPSSSYSLRASAR